MIFVTVGTQLPFERLIKAVDQWSERHLEMEVVAQIGSTRYQPKFMEYVVKFSPRQYAETFEQASVVISHAGVGTIIRGLENAKPLVLMPRLAAQGEHRSDHQLSTARKFARSGLIDIVTTDQELGEAISKRLGNRAAHEDTVAGVKTSPELLARLRLFASAG